MSKVRNEEEYIISSSNWLETHFIHTYLKNKYKNRYDILVIPTSNPSSFEGIYLDTKAHLDQAQDAITTDIIVPFHMEPSKHFTLLHIKLVGIEQNPVFTWVDSMGGSMPAAVETAINKMEEWKGKKKTIIKSVPSHQIEGYDCAVYVARNADLMVNGSNNFKTMTSAESLQLRQQMVEIVNDESEEQYVFVNDKAESTVSKSKAETPKTTKTHKTDPNQWDEKKFVGVVSNDLIDFGASLQGAGTQAAFKSFDEAFDIAAKAYQNAHATLAGNPHAFFNEYKTIKAKLDRHNAKSAQVQKSCATEAERVLEEGKDFVRVI